jgi:hypothetical protein
MCLNTVVSKGVREALVLGDGKRLLLHKAAEANAVLEGYVDIARLGAGVLNFAASVSSR